MHTWQLNPQVRLRRTADGGAVFLPETVTTVELDAEAWAALSLLAGPQTARDLRPPLNAQFRRNLTLAEIDILLGELAAQGFLRQVEGICGACGYNAFCKGCRAVVQLQTGNWKAADNDCALAS